MCIVFRCESLAIGCIFTSTGVQRSAKESSHRTGVRFCVDRLALRTMSAMLYWLSHCSAILRLFFWYVSGFAALECACFPIGQGQTSVHESNSEIALSALMI